mmetsp:Transcript_62495/g.179724  ORF Transcript_62495/g.179724 Transcript_62495/m.179724 type:complete len:217 (-) Transcript_62495:1078-1728(-)
MVHFTPYALQALDMVPRIASCGHCLAAYAECNCSNLFPKLLHHHSDHQSTTRVQSPARSSNTSGPAVETYISNRRSMSSHFASTSMVSCLSSASWMPRKALACRAAPLTASRQLSEVSALPWGTGTACCTGPCRAALSCRASGCCPASRQRCCPSTWRGGWLCHNGGASWRRGACGSEARPCCCREEMRACRRSPNCRSHSAASGEAGCLRGGGLG